MALSQILLLTYLLSVVIVCIFYRPVHPPVLPSAGWEIFTPLHFYNASTFCCYVERSADVHVIISSVCLSVCRSVKRCVKTT